MKTWGLKLVGRDGRPNRRPVGDPAFRGRLPRSAAGLAGYALLGRWGLLFGLINHAWGSLDPDRQFLHDRIAGTQLVRG
jgi:hypothetical protein